MPAPRTLRFGFSPCPNDTFAFWAAVHGEVPADGYRIQAVLADIETLNQRGVAGDDPLEATKLSIPALAAAAERYAALPAGAALGFGVGPLLVVRAKELAIGSLEELSGRLVAVPGFHTTAYLLLRLFAPRDCLFLPMPFQEVMPAVARGACDAGLVIHEGRFTYAQHGLRPLLDLGERWEEETGGPVPLAVIGARRDLDGDAFSALAGALRASVERAFAHPGAPRPYVRAHAQALDDDVCDRHIGLYVNEFTVDLGTRGRGAVDALLARARRAGLLPAGPSPWRGGA